MDSKQEVEVQANNVPTYLADSWKLNNKNVSIKDDELMESTKDKKKLELSHFYQTHLLPLPWWGNI